tara:strand:+ start:264 stop:1412 length:1149 start_codon:yes stop_codon:yes gene_type:complete
MLNFSVDTQNFTKKKKVAKIKKNLHNLLLTRNELLKSLSSKYVNNYRIRNIKKIVGKNKIRLIGMGGSILGAQAIYNFLKDRVKKEFIFIGNLEKKQKKDKNKITNLVISKSGNTLETIANANILIKNNDKNIFITEKKENYLFQLAQKLKAEIIYHNNYIGGRYSVLSEVGMLPAELMGFNPKNFRQYDDLIKNRNFLKYLVHNVSSILFYIEKKFNSVIINYDNRSDYLFQWYRQLVAESLGKKGKGFLPIISSMPKDNHSVMQLYLDGRKNNFFTFFYCKDKNSDKLNRNFLPSHKFLNKFQTQDIIFKQKKATEKIFIKKNMPFRSFDLKYRNEKTLGEIFCYFILETILIGRALNVNPYDQPSVELIKKETKKLFFK